MQDFEAMLSGRSVFGSFWAFSCHDIQQRSRWRFPDTADDVLLAAKNRHQPILMGQLLRKRLGNGHTITLLSVRPWTSLSPK